ncbi:14089_t:CDS:2 [Funneliformis caledonium]|uniref:14089_t:CDS:1 n=1 Tax=Funneliformis caledonium TaxID=1117310 RepID=A0A9N9DR02_9GLOM|nr:14089_t:CDS:2 [Funneliformis caledonium]
MFRNYLENAIMPNNSSIYIIIWLFIQLLIEVNCQTTLFNPLQRYVHTATLIDDKIYFLGGRDDMNTVKIGREFFYLDVSVPFDTQTILWHDLTSFNTVPAHISAASVNGGANNKTLFLYGGVTHYNATMALVYSFDTQYNSWSIPNLSSDNVIRKDNLKGIVDDNGKMYLFGGHSNGTRYNDMLILNTITLKWEIGTTNNAPSPRSLYGTTYVSQMYIVYLGGYYATSDNDGVSLSLKEVYYYNMADNYWLTRVTSGLDEQRIIIFGGTNNLNNLTPREALYVLNLVNFEWSIPKVSGKIPGSRYWHQANVVEKYMVISFGYGYNRKVDNDILLLDISNDEEYMWTNIFDPNELKSPPPTESPKVSPNTPATLVMFGVSIGTCAVIISLLIGGFYLYKWRKNKMENIRALPTPGSADNNNYVHEALAVSTRSNVYNHGQETIPTHENTHFIDNNRHRY